MGKEFINPKEAAQPVGPYSQVVKAKAGQIIMVAGQVAFNKKGEMVGKGDAAAQTRQIMKNMEACLKAAGATFADVVKVNTYVTDMRTKDEVLKVRQEFFKGNKPAGTLVGVETLAYPGLMVEIEAMAII